MILDELFGPPISTKKTIVRKNGKMKVEAKPVSYSNPSIATKKTFFPISKERK